MFNTLKDVITIKKALKIILLVLCVLVVAVGVFAFIQRNNLSALHLAVHHDESEAAAEMQAAEQNISAALDIDLDKVKADASMIYEAEAVEDNPVEQDATPPAVAPSDEAPASGVGKTGSNGKADKRSNVGKDGGTNAEVEALITRFYVLEARFLGRLSAIEASASQRYHALPPKDRTKRALASILSSCISQANALESECDGAVYSLIGELKSVLKKSGGDLSVAAEIESCYATEKSLKKAEYMSKYLNYLS